MDNIKYYVKKKYKVVWRFKSSRMWWCVMGCI